MDECEMCPCCAQYHCGCECRWISVKERLPPIIKRVLVYTEWGRVFDAAWYGACWQEKCGNYLMAFDGVTHWMSLPEPPKEGTINVQL
jgi:hypothetical protein